jgi:DNA-binding beta-propeller fold protein YncE
MGSDLPNGQDVPGSDGHTHVIGVGVGARVLIAAAVLAMVSALTDRAATPALLSAATQTPPHVTQVMSGLDNPRGLAFGPDGALYVAEAGRGPSDQSCFADPSQSQCTCGSAGGPVGCSGPTGAVSRFWKDRQERVLEGLPSWSIASGRAEGPNGVAMLGLGEAFVTIGLEAAPRTVDFMRQVLGDGFGRLVHFTPGGQWRFVADLVDYEKQFNPEPRVVDSNPFGLLVAPAGVVVVDAGGNDVLLVDASRHISTLAIIPSVSQASSGDAVPTSIAVGPDGAYYIGELTGAPFREGASTIFRLIPGAAPEPFLTGFKAVIGVAFDREGNLYVLQHSTGVTGLTAPGVLIRVAPDGTRTTVMSGLDRPTGLAIGPDGAAYVSVHGQSVAIGEVLRLEL